MQKKKALASLRRKGLFLCQPLTLAKSFMLGPSLGPYCLNQDFQDSQDLQDKNQNNRKFHPENPENPVNPDSDN